MNCLGTPSCVGACCELESHMSSSFFSLYRKGVVQVSCIALFWCVCVYACMCVYACVRACMHMCVCVCVRTRVRACVISTNALKMSQQLFNACTLKITQSNDSGILVPIREVHIDRVTF